MNLYAYSMLKQQVTKLVSFLCYYHVNLFLNANKQVFIYSVHLIID